MKKLMIVLMILLSSSLIADPASFKDTAPGDGTLSGREYTPTYGACGNPVGTCSPM